MPYSYDNKALTISEVDLTSEESKTVKSLIRLGDSKELALWTIEHQERQRPDNSESCYNAYCI